MGFVLRRAAFTIAGASRNVIAEVIDAHLEMASMIFLTTIWAVTFAWFEGTAEDVGKWFHYFNLPWPASLIGTFSTYHLVLGVSVFAISFSFGFLKFTRMLWHRKRYLMFTALGNYPYALALEDFLYFVFSKPYARLAHNSWTCSILSLGCWDLKLPWGPQIPWNATVPDYYRYIPIEIPRWYLIAFEFSALMFFLAYRSALVNLLVTREVMKQGGFLEKTLISPPTSIVPLLTPSPPETAGPRESAKEAPPPSQVTRIVDTDRDELIQKLRKRLERQGA